MIRVFATREGLIGHQTASGYRIDNVVNFVALPHVNALGKHVRLWADNDEFALDAVIAQVLDVGPHNDLDPYVFQQSTMGQVPALTKDIRPMAEEGISRVNGHDYHAKNIAGIDLGEAVWNALGMKDNGYVWWEFVNWRG